MALTHHERWDGCGYPKGLKDSEIPVVGRVTSLADIFDALISERPYKETFPQEKAFTIIRENRGTLFDLKQPIVTFYLNTNIIAGNEGR
ncbi:HD-GYP domain-containing protein [Chloroflexota bacterium]